MDGWYEKLPSHIRTAKRYITPKFLPSPDASHMAEEVRTPAQYGVDKTPNIERDKIGRESYVQTCGTKKIHSEHFRGFPHYKTRVIMVGVFLFPFFDFRMGDIWREVGWIDWCNMEEMGVLFEQRNFDVGSLRQGNDVILEAAGNEYLMNKCVHVNDSIAGSRQCFSIISIIHLSTRSISSLFLCICEAAPKT